MEWISGYFDHTSQRYVPCASHASLDSHSVPEDQEEYRESGEEEELDDKTDDSDLMATVSTGTCQIDTPSRPTQ